VSLPLSAPAGRTVRLSIVSDDRIVLRYPRVSVELARGPASGTAVPVRQNTDLDATFAARYPEDVPLKIAPYADPATRRVLYYAASGHGPGIPLPEISHVGFTYPPSNPPTSRLQFQLLVDQKDSGQVDGKRVIELPMVTGAQRYAFPLHLVRGGGRRSRLVEVRLLKPAEMPADDFQRVSLPDVWLVRRRGAS
jgi:hypothetical protein